MSFLYHLKLWCFVRQWQDLGSSRASCRRWKTQVKRLGFGRRTRAPWFSNICALGSHYLFVVNCCESHVHVLDKQGNLIDQSPGYFIQCTAWRHTYPNLLCPVVPSIPVDDKNCFNLDSCAKVDCQPWKRFFWRVTDVPCLPFIHADNAIDTIGCIITTRHCARHHCIYRPQFQSWNCNLDDGHVKFKMSNTPFTLCVVAHHILYFLSLKPFPREPGGK